MRSNISTLQNFRVSKTPKKILYCKTGKNIHCSLEAPFMIAYLIILVNMGHFYLHHLCSLDEFTVLPTVHWPLLQLNRHWLIFFLIEADSPSHCVLHSSGLFFSKLSYSSSVFRHRNISHTMSSFNPRVLIVSTKHVSVKFIYT